MIYSEKLPKNNKSTLRVKFSDFSKGINTKVNENILPLNYAVNTYNYSYNSGALKEGLGIKSLEIPIGSTTKSMILPSSVNKVLKFWFYRRYDNVNNKFSPLMMIYCDDKKLYYGRLDTLDNEFRETGLEFDVEPIGMNYRLDGVDSFLCCVPNGIGVYSNTKCLIYTENVPSITSAALHAGRLFATTGGDQSQLWFSDDLNPTNWNVNEFDGGYIELTDDRGTLKKVIESNNYLYVIREYGISRVSGWGMQSDFNVKNLYLTTGKLYYNSAILCGRIIMMLCRDGIYYFNGEEMNKLQLGLDKYFENTDNSNAVGAFLDNKYYLACRLNYNDNVVVGCENSDYINNTLLEYDFNNGDLNLLRGVDICSLTAFQTEDFSKLITCFNGENSTLIGELTHDGKVFNQITEKVWTSPLTDMGYTTYKKVIKAICLNSLQDVTIVLNADGKDYTYLGKGDKKPIRIPINIAANRFSITFKTNTQTCEISNPVLEVALI